ncbi:MAG: LytTR family DNA-binding domain-containing protein [Oscillospiraceae bacterium]
MFNICLCDDNEQALKQYADIISKIGASEKIALQICTYSSGEQLLFEADDVLCNFDIVYLDMLMGKLDGIETARALRNIGFAGQIIFLTSSKDHALEAFDVMPLHYIIKQDTTDDKFCQVFLKAIALTKNHQTQSFVFETQGKVNRVPLEDILYFEVRIRQVFLYTATEHVSFYSQIAVVEKQLEKKYFVRCHRSFVVNLKHIRSISNCDIELTNGHVLPIGSKYLKDLRHSFSEYLESKSVML